MDGYPPETTVTPGRLAARVRAAAPRCGSTRLVLVDGRSGAGKTTLAGVLAAALDDAPVLHMDELYPGWDGLAAAVPLLRGVLDDVAAGRPARYRPWDWRRDAPGAERDLGTPPVLIVEGAGAGAPAVAGFAVLLVWVHAERDERYRRAIARDGRTYRPHWDRWARQEDAHFAAAGTRHRADVEIRTDQQGRSNGLTP